MAVPSARRPTRVTIFIFVTTFVGSFCRGGGDGEAAQVDVEASDGSGVMLSAYAPTTFRSTIAAVQFGYGF